MENEKCEHSLSVIERKRFCATCVKDVNDLSAEKIVLTLFSGARMIVLGEGLKIAAFSRQSGQLTVDGLINDIKYAGEKIPLLKKLIK